MSGMKQPQTADCLQCDKKTTGPVIIPFSQLGVAYSDSLFIDRNSNGTFSPYRPQTNRRSKK